MPKRKPKINPTSPQVCQHCDRALTSKYAVKHHTCRAKATAS